MDEVVEILLIMFDSAPMIVGAVAAVVAAVVGAPLALKYLRTNSDIARRVSGDSVALAGGAATADLGASRKEKVFTAISNYFHKDLANKSVSELKVLKKQLVQAGFFAPRAAAWFFASRVGLAAALGL